MAKRGICKVILLGNIGDDPTTRYTPDGGAITNITVATSETWKDKTSGEQKERTEWTRVIFFNKLAEIAAQYLKKGSKVYIEGSLRTRQWEKEGQKHYTTEVVADELQMLDSKQDAPADESSARRPAPRTQAPQQSNMNMGADDFLDDIPF